MNIKSERESDGEEHWYRTGKAQVLCVEKSGLEFQFCYYQLYKLVNVFKFI